MINVENLSISFKGNQILKNISVRIDNGSVVGIVGASGSGKSTFLKCLNLLETPDEGKIYFNGELIIPDNILAIRQKLGMVFQNFNLFNHLNVVENLTYAPIKIGRLTKKNAYDKAVDLLKKIGLEDKENAYPHQLSGGQKQRVAIARTLMMDPEVILFDEPTSALDPELVQEVLQVIQSLAHTGITMLIVSHEMAFIKNIADRILFFDEGVIIEDATPQIFFDQPATQRAKNFLEKIL